VLTGIAGGAAVVTACVAIVIGGRAAALVVGVWPPFCRSASARAAPSVASSATAAASGHSRRRRRGGTAASRTVSAGSSAALRSRERVAAEARPRGRVERETREHRRVEPCRHVGRDGARRERRLALAEEHELGQARRLERHAPGQRLVEDDAERVQVGRGAGGLAASLLRREIRSRPEHRALLRERSRLARARDPEVTELHRAVPAAEDVLRLHIPVHDPGRVRRGERRAEVEPEHDGLRRLQPPAPRELLRERLALDVLGDEVRALLVLAGVVDLDHVRVHEPRREPRLAEEARPQLGVGRNAR
jgi:hypothetical protein